MPALSLDSGIERCAQSRTVAQRYLKITAAAPLVYGWRLPFPRTLTDEKGRFELVSSVVVFSGKLTFPVEGGSKLGDREKIAFYRLSGLNPGWRLLPESAVQRGLPCAHFHLLLLISIWNQISHSFLVVVILPAGRQSPSDNGLQLSYS